jgi:hypothetical protein
MGIMKIKVVRVIMAPGCDEAIVEARVPVSEAAKWQALGDGYAHLRPGLKTKLKVQRVTRLLAWAPSASSRACTDNPLRRAVMAHGCTRAARLIDVEPSEMRRWWRDGKPVPEEHMTALTNLMGGHHEQR